MKKSNIRMLCLCVMLMLVFSNIATVNAAKVTRTNQDITAYVGGTITASGKIPEVGYCAVHNKNNNPLTPIIPFGTVINIIEIRDPYGEVTDAVFHPYYGEMNALQVQDTGDERFILSTYFIDVYFGDTSYEDDADEFGQRKVDYSYYN